MVKLCVVANSEKNADGIWQVSLDRDWCGIGDVLLSDSRDIFIIGSAPKPAGNAFTYDIAAIVPSTFRGVSPCRKLIAGMFLTPHPSTSTSTIPQGFQSGAGTPVGAAIGATGNIGHTGVAGVAGEGVVFLNWEISGTCKVGKDGLMDYNPTKPVTLENGSLFAKIAEID